MMKTDFLRGLLILSCVLPASLSHADAPRQLTWEELTPKVAVSENPFSKLSREQLRELTEVAAVRDRRARGDKTVSPLEIETERATSHRLEQSGLDVDGLLARRKEMTEQQRLRGQAMNSFLDGQTVRMPGYLLPLEFSGKRVTEFLLVPWVGACIHTPPPPPNQIVHVKADKPAAFTGLFAPVWVTGQMSINVTKKSVYILDGAADMNVGYSLRASEVEPYKQ